MIVTWHFFALSEICIWINEFHLCPCEKKVAVSDSLSFRMIDRSKSQLIMVLFQGRGKLEVIHGYWYVYSHIVDASCVVLPPQTDIHLIILLLLFISGVWQGTYILHYYFVRFLLAFDWSESLGLEARHHTSSSFPNCRPAPVYVCVCEWDKGFKVLCRT